MEVHEIRLEPIETTDRKGNRHQFWCSVRNDFNRWHVSVWETEDTGQEHYGASFAQLGEELLQSVALDNHNQPWAKRKGISEAVLRLIHDRSGRPIVSSRTWKEEGEWRTPRATAMWERFVRNGLSALLPELDRFVYPAEAKDSALVALHEMGEHGAR